MLTNHVWFQFTVLKHQRAKIAAAKEKEKTNHDKIDMTNPSTNPSTSVDDTVNWIHYWMF